MGLILSYLDSRVFAAIILHSDKPGNRTTGKKRLVYTYYTVHYGLQRGVTWNNRIILTGMALYTTKPLQEQRAILHSGYT